MGNAKHRRSIRLPGYDYTSSGAYFITICTHEKQKIFGEIIDEKMILNEIGKIVADEWIKTAIIRPYIELDNFIVMPNHFHGIIWMIYPYGRGTARRAPTVERFGIPSIGSILFQRLLGLLNPRLPGV